MKRKVFFVCCGTVEGSLKSEIIEASSKQDAFDIFKSRNKFSPEFVSPSFYKKHEKFLYKKLNNIKFTQKTIQTIYGGWNITAKILEDPANFAYIIIKNHVSNPNKKKPQPKPGMHILLPLSEIGIFNE